LNFKEAIDLNEIEISFDRKVSKTKVEIITPPKIAGTLLNCPC
jgi:hypothetical protein